MLTLLTPSISRCERCIHIIVSTSFTSMYYRVYIVHIVDIVIHEMNGKFGLFCLFVVGRDVLSLSVPQSVHICLRIKFCLDRRVLCACSCDVRIYAHHFAPTFDCGGQRRGYLLWLKPISCRIFADFIKQLYTFISRCRRYKRCKRSIRG